MLIRALPSEAVLWSVQREAEEKAQRALTSVERLRERQAHYAQQREASGD